MGNDTPSILGPIIGAVVGALITGAITILLYFLQRKRPQYLICEEISRTVLESELIEIEEVREQTEIRYGGTRVDRLSLEKLRLLNQGTAPLEDEDFTVRFNPEVKILGPIWRPLREREIAVLPTKIKENEVILHIYYLNPFTTFKHEVIIDLICDGEITKVDAFGGGPGWSVKSVSLEEKEEIRVRKELINSLLIGAAAMALVGIFILLAGGATTADIGLNAIDAVLGTIRGLYARLVGDSFFRAGFWWGLFIALFIGWVSWQLLYQWSRILQFFGPTRRSATAPGRPSLFNTWVRAISALVALALILVFILLLMARRLGLI